jgi:hypothetical protein
MYSPRRAGSSVCKGKRYTDRPSQYQSHLPDHPPQDKLGRTPCWTSSLYGLQPLYIFTQFLTKISWQMRKFPFFPLVFLLMPISISVLCFFGFLYPLPCQYFVPDSFKYSMYVHYSHLQFIFLVSVDRQVTIPSPPMYPLTTVSMSHSSPGGGRGERKKEG